MCSCSITAAGDVLFVNTSNGVDDGHINIPAPNAPSFMCLDKNTGKVLWTDNSPGTNILHGQWSSPTYAVLGGSRRCIFGGGDGWLYSFDPHGGTATANRSCCGSSIAIRRNRNTSLGGKSTRNHIIGTPVIYDGLVYVGVGEDPEHGEGVGHFWCIDPTKRGDVSPELVFNSKDPKNPIARKRKQARADASGDGGWRSRRPNPNSAAVWHYVGEDAERQRQARVRRIDAPHLRHRGDQGRSAVHRRFQRPLPLPRRQDRQAALDLRHAAACWGSCLIVDGKVYIGDEDGDVAIFKLSPKTEHALEEGRRQAWRNQHGQHRLQHADRRQQRALHLEQESPVRDHGGGRKSRRRISNQRPCHCLAEAAKDLRKHVTIFGV